eukprot:714005-Pyramimonas_sp.AAC.1
MSAGPARPFSGSAPSLPGPRWIASPLGLRVSPRAGGRAGDLLRARVSRLAGRLPSPKVAR